MIPKPRLNLLFPNLHIFKLLIVSWVNAHDHLVHIVLYFFKIQFENFLKTVKLFILLRIWLITHIRISLAYVENFFGR